MTASPEVSVVIPTRDRWPILESSGLRAAFLQENIDFEVIVVDDGSTREIPARLAEIDDPRLRMIRHQESKGVAAARNLGVATARGEWVAFLDDDDLWSPRKLRAQLNAARTSDAGFVFSGVVVVGDECTVLHVTRPATISASDLMKRNVVPAGSSNVLARTALVREVGGFDERLTYVADWDLWIRLALKSRVATHPEPLVGYVRRGSGMKFSGRDAINEIRYFLDKHHDAGISADPARFLGWVALQDRRAGRRRSAAVTFLSAGIAYRTPRHLARSAVALVGPGCTRFSASSAQHETERVTSRDLVDVEWLAHYR